MEEISVYRIEDKYIVKYDVAAKIQEDLSKVLKIDDNARNNGYKIKNVYFDSINNLDFHSKLNGVEVRKKIRIRVYDTNSDKCKLELKQKTSNLQHKISIWITKKDAIELISGKYNVLVKYFEQSKDAVMIYKIMCLGCYRPVCYIEYNRTAYTHPLYNTRITFDTSLKSSEINFNIFENNIVCNAIQKENVILEIKYNGKIPIIVSDILKKYNLNRSAISKYCLSRPLYYSLINY